jgi:hypothetical protein
MELVLAADANAITTNAPLRIEKGTGVPPFAVYI